MQLISRGASMPFSMKSGEKPLRIWLRGGALVFALFACLSMNAQIPGDVSEAQNAYRLPLPVNEVVLTFHALDILGLSVNNLRRDEIRIFDNELPAVRIVAFDALLDRPIRVGILIDSSESMQLALFSDKLLAEQFVQKLFRQESDQAFVMNFGYSSEFIQSWTNNPMSLSRGIQNIQTGKMNRLGGTAIFDTIFRACQYGFNKIDPILASNVILLFSDGEDTASHTSPDEALGACQKSNVAIYAFRNTPSSGRDSMGPQTLADLSSKSGGRVFPVVNSEEEIRRDLRTIEAEIRNQYRLVYDPASLKRDGSFHRIAILPPERVSSISVRSGYYAPSN
jgi:Ca-activated chloride channel homolog